MSLNNVSGKRQAVEDLPRDTKRQCPTIRRQRRDSAIPATQRQDSATVTLCPLQHRRFNLEQTRKNGTVPVIVVIEHCYYLRNAAVGAGRIGDTIVEVNRQAVTVDTAYSPLEGIHGTPFSEVENAVRRVYEAGCANRHRGHKHPSRRDGDYIVEFSLRTHGGEMVINAGSWMKALRLLMITKDKSGAVPTCNAVLTARLTCAAFGRGVRWDWRCW